MNENKDTNHFIVHVLCTGLSLKLQIPRRQSQKDILKTTQH